MHSDEDSSAGTASLLAEALKSPGVPPRKQQLKEIMKRPSSKDAKSKGAKSKGHPAVCSEEAGMKKPGSKKKKNAGVTTKTGQSGSFGHADIGAAPNQGHAKKSAGSKKEFTGTGKKFQNYQFESEAFGLCKAEFYTAKSYIRKHDADTGKWTLIVQAEGNRHQEKINSLVPHAKEAGMTTEQLVMLRAIV